MEMATANALPAPVAGTAPSLLRIYLLEAKYEFMKLLRMPHYVVGTLGFPIMFYLLFGVGLAQKSSRGIGSAQYLLASYSVFGVISAALFAFGAGVAVERAQGWMTLKRATPMPVGAYLSAKVAAAMAFGTIILVLMGLCAITVGDVRLPPGAWLQMWAVLVLGCVPFCLAGLIIAFTVPPTGAPGIVNLVNLPLAFAAGLWFPITMLPRAIQVIAPILPQYHAGQLALGAIGAVDAPRTLEHVLALLEASVVFGIGAWWAWRRSDAEV